MVIGFDASRAFQQDRTGTENYSFQLLKSLSKIDRKNKYIVYVRPNSVIARSPRRPWQSFSNFQFKVIKWPRLWTQGGLALQTFKDKLDALFVPAHTLPLIRRPGLKTVLTVHDLGSEYLPGMHQLKQRLYLSFIQKYQLQTATKIIAVSKATKVDLTARIGINPEKIQVIYEGFDRMLFKPTKGSPYKNYYLFVGTVQPRKNLERLIKAFSVIARRKSSTDAAIFSDHGRSSRRFAPQDDNLVIAGSRGWLSDEIYELPKKLGIENRVKFLGYVPDQDLPALYSGAIALTFPSLFEGFGLPILEAQACGCPVLTSNISSMPEIGGKEAVYVDPYDVNDIVKGMDRVKREGERVKLIKSGFENVKRFNWEKAAKETLQVLESV